MGDPEEIFEFRRLIRLEVHLFEHLEKLLQVQRVEAVKLGRVIEEMEVHG
jgi:hypothetical protein